MIKNARYKTCITDIPSIYPEGYADETKVRRRWAESQGAWEASTADRDGRCDRRQSFNERCERGLTAVGFWREDREAGSSSRQQVGIYTAQIRALHDEQLDVRRDGLVRRSRRRSTRMCVPHVYARVAHTSGGLGRLGGDSSHESMRRKRDRTSSDPFLNTSTPRAGSHVRPGLRFKLEPSPVGDVGVLLDTGDKTMSSLGSVWTRGRR